MKISKKKLIVIGGGFAGIKLINSIDYNLFEILLIDKVNHHQFQPLLYQVATSQIEASGISFPLRQVFSAKKKVKFRLAEVNFIDQINKFVHTTIGNFEFDYLCIATGCTTNFFGNIQVEKHALTLKSTWEAIKIKNHVLLTFEKIISSSPEEKEGLLNFIIVGGGPTGVELAGAFADIKNYILPKDYPDTDFSGLNIILIDNSKSVLANMSKFSQSKAESYLKKMGVRLIMKTSVENYDGKSLYLNNGTILKTNTVIWAAGITGNIVKGIESHCIRGQNRIKVNEINQVEGSLHVFAIGDIACMETTEYLKGHPQIANVAIKQARLMAKNLARIVRNENTVKFNYRSIGSMATIGRNKAVVDFSYLQLSGFFAWLIWMVTHLMYILSVRNKIIIFIDWTRAYFIKNTSLRLIFGKYQK